MHSISQTKLGLVVASFAALIFGSGFVSPVSAADTVQDFTATFYPQPSGVPFVANGSTTVVAGTLDGSPANAGSRILRVSQQVNLGVQSNVYFDQVASNTGAYDNLLFEFDMNMNNPVSGADGLAFAYLDTAVHGTTGFAAGFGEDPNLAGSLGVGFDTWNNGPGDGFPGGSEASLPDSFSLHFNNVTLANVPMSALSIPNDWLENGISKHVSILVEKASSPATGVNVSVNVAEYGGAAVDPFVAVNIPDMSTYNGRIAYGSRTGGESQNADVDNVVTTFTPSGGAPFSTLVHSFDVGLPPVLAGGTPFSGAQHGAIPGPLLIQNSGPFGSPQPAHMQLTNENGSVSNSIAFDKTSNLKGSITANFDFQIVDTGAASSADGMAFMLLDTATYGDSGAIPGGYIAFEDPNLAGVLGVGFDTFSGGPGNSDFCADCAGNRGNQVSIHFNGATIAETTFPLADLALVNGAMNHATVLVEEAPGGMLVYLQLTDGTDGSVHDLFNGVFVPGSFVGSTRVAFGARTGGAADFYNIDNVNVSFVPEPSSVVLGILGTAGLAIVGCRRRGKNG